MARQHKQFGRRLFIVYAPLAVITIAVCVVAHSAIARQLNEWKLLPQPERFTELYFTHPASLPATYTPGQTQTIAFTAHNLEHRTTTYSYTITANGTKLSNGTFILAENQTRQVADTVTLPPLGNRAEITVTLTNVHTSIDYWVNVGTEAKP